MAAEGHRRAAVLGHPVAHSLSPLLHRTAYAELGLDWRYDAVDVTGEGLAAFLDRLGPEWVGLSLTMPLKETVIELLDDVAPEAARVRSVNTVLLSEGRRRGCNTDVTGLVGLLESAGLSPRVGARPTAVVIGAGATARSAVAALAECGVVHAGVSARRPEAAADLAALAGRVGMTSGAVAWPPTGADLEVDVVVSTVPSEAGAVVEAPSQPSLLVDVIYDPWPTPLARAWAEAGGPVVGGLELLVRQAVEQVALMTGRRPDPQPMRRAGEGELARRRGLREIAQADQ